MRFFKCALFILFSAGLVSVAVPQDQAGIPELSIDTSLEMATSTATIAYRLGPGNGIETALRFDRQNQILRLPYFRIQGWGTEFFVGRGSPGQGRALRLNPARMGTEAPASPWEARTGSLTVPLIAGFKIGGLLCQSLWNSEEILDLARLGESFTVPEPAFKAAAMEASGSAPGISWAGGIGAARDEGRDSPEGWKAGSNSEPGTELLSLGGSAGFKVGPIAASLWLAGSAGSIVPPGAAGAVDAGLSWTNALAGDTDEVLGNAFTLSLKVSVYGCSRYYRTYLAEKPDLDCAIKADATVGFHGLRAWAGFSALSPFESQGAFGLRKIQEKGMESLLWRWRTERIQGLLGVGIRQASLSARGFAGSKGLDKLELLLGYTSQESRPHPLTFRTALKALFSATSESQVTSLDEESFATELGETLSDEYGDEKNGVLPGKLWLMRLRLDASLAWKKARAAAIQAATQAIAKGQASAALALDFGAEGLEFRIHAELFQRIPLGLRSSVELRLSTPSEGYHVDSMPAEWPEIGLAASIF